jgi:hypothetical protein
MRRKKAHLAWTSGRRNNFQIFELVIIQWLRRIMEKPTEEQIRRRAHEIWERNQRPDGRDDEFWHQAEKELLNEAGQGDSKGNFNTPDVLPG